MGWYTRARKFILEQRRTELVKAINRYPLSDRYVLRLTELNEINAELKVLESE